MIIKDKYYIKPYTQLLAYFLQFLIWTWNFMARQILFSTANSNNNNNNNNNNNYNNNNNKKKIFWRHKHI